MKKTLIILWALVMTVGVIFPNFFGSIFDTLKLGATSFPTSLDSFTNPSATDSVATVSHFGQHSNANDAIEAIEAKVGITASTPTANTVFYGDGAGSSVWSGTPSLSTLSLSSTLSVTGLSTFAGFISTASSTINGGFHITGNSTTTNATTTIGAFTGHASSTAWRGGGLATDCITGNFLTWTAATGLFGCGADQTGTLTFGNATTTNTGAGAPAYQVISTTTVMSAGQTLMVWSNASFTGNAGGTKVYLTVKPPTLASTTIAAGFHSSEDPVHVPLSGSFVAVEAGTHKITLWDNAAGSGLAGLEASGFSSTSIMFINLGG